MNINFEIERVKWKIMNIVKSLGRLRPWKILWPPGNPLATLGKYRLKITFANGQFCALGILADEPSRTWPMYARSYLYSRFYLLFLLLWLWEENQFQGSTATSYSIYSIAWKWNSEQKLKLVNRQQLPKLFSIFCLLVLDYNIPIVKQCAPIAN